MSLFNRAEVVDKNFTSRIKEGKLPDSRTHLPNKNQSISDLDLISIFESQVASRHMDLKARLVGHLFMMQLFLSWLHQMTL